MQALRLHSKASCKGSVVQPLLELPRSVVLSPELMRMTIGRTDPAIAASDATGPFWPDRFGGPGLLSTPSYLTLAASGRSGSVA